MDHTGFQYNVFVSLQIILKYFKEKKTRSNLFRFNPDSCWVVCYLRFLPHCMITSYVMWWKRLLSSYEFSFVVQASIYTCLNSHGYHHFCLIQYAALQIYCHNCNIKILLRNVLVIKPLQPHLKSLIAVGISLCWKVCKCYLLLSIGWKFNWTQHEWQSRAQRSQPGLESVLSE